MLSVPGQIGVVLELGQVPVLIGVAGLIDVVVPGPEVEILKVPGQIALNLEGVPESLWRPDFLVPPWHWVESDVVR